MTMATATAIRILHPDSMRTARTDQKVRHLLHPAIFDTTSAIASDNPRCCISEATAITINAIPIIVRRS